VKFVTARLWVVMVGWHGFVVLRWVCCWCGCCRCLVGCAFLVVRWGWGFGMGFYLFCVDHVRFAVVFLVVSGAS